MRILTTAAMLASVLGPLATTALAADLDYDGPPPPPPPYYEPRPVPPAFVPDPVPPVVYRAPVVYPRLVRAYPRPLYGPRPVVRVYDEPYAEGYGRRGYGEPGYEHDRVVVRRDREEFGRGYEREHEVTRHEREGDRYGHYLSREELERRAERGGYGHEERFSGREHGYGRDDRFADRDFDR